MSFRIDHVVILVRDLAQASEQYTNLGFTVTPGGEHSDGATHNALVALADGSYLELIAFKRDAPKHRWWRHVARGAGLIDWALLPSDIAEDIAEAAERGVSYSGPIDGGRTRPDGAELHWQTGLPPTDDLPFLCADVTPRNLRVPQGVAQRHSNGASGIGAIAIAVANLSRSATRYAGLLGAIYEPTGPNECAFQLDTTTILLRTVADSADEGIAGLTLTTSSGPLAIV